MLCDFSIDDVNVNGNENATNQELNYTDNIWVQGTDKVLVKENFELAFISNNIEEFSNQLEFGSQMAMLCPL